MQQQSTIMDELFFPTSSSIPHSPASFYSASHNQVLQFAPFEVLEPWRAADDVVGLHEPLGGAALGDGGSSSVGNDDLSGNSPAPAATAAKRRGRKPGPRSDGEPAIITPVEAERQRRDKLNRLFCELRAAVPTVSRLDRASLLADAAGYIAELRRRVEQLEAKVRRDTAVARHGAPAPTNLTTSHSFIGNDLEEKLEVRMVRPGAAAALRLTTAARHAPARLMDALRSLDLTVQHACICRVGGVTVHDAVVDVPAAAAGLQDEGGLRAALLYRLQLN